MVPKSVSAEIRVRSSFRAQATATSVAKIANPLLLHLPLPGMDLYQVNPATVALYRLPDIRVIKASFPRPVVQGSFADRDMHSGQQRIPLAGLPITTPEDVIALASGR